MFSLAPSGGVKNLILLGNQLRERGYEVVFYVAEAEGEFPLQYANECELVYAPPARRGVFKRIYWLSRVDSDAAVAIATFYPTAFAVWLNKSPFRKRVYYIQAYEVLFYRWPMLRVIRRANLMLLAQLSYFLPLDQVVNCKGSALGIFPRSRRNRAVEIPQGINLDIYKPESREQKRVRIGHLSRPAKWKGSAEVFQAMRVLREEIGADFDLVIAYDLCPDTCGLEYEVHKPETEQELANFYSSCDIVISSGYGQGTGYPFLESRASGAICFATDSEGGTPYVDYIPIKRGDVQSIVDAFIWYRGNPEKIPAMIQAGLKTVSAYGWDEVMQGWVEVVKS